MTSACVLTQYGPADVLKWKDVAIAEPSEGQVRIQVRVSGVGPTDLKIRCGDLHGAFRLPEPAVLGFETTGVVDAIRSEVSGTEVGDEVAAWLPSLAVTSSGGRERVITLADEHTAELGVRLSAAPPDRAPDAVEIGMELLASGELRLRWQRSLPMSAAAEAHRLLEARNVHDKLLLSACTGLAETVK